MKITRTIRQAPNATPKPAVVIADEDTEHAVFLPESEVDAALRKLVFTDLPDTALGWMAEDAKAAAKAAGGNPAAAVLPFKVVALGIKNRGLFQRAMDGNLIGRDLIQGGGVLCKLGSAISAAMGQKAMSDWLDLSGRTFFVIAEFPGEYRFLESELFPKDRPVWERLATETTVVTQTE